MFDTYGIILIVLILLAVPTLIGCAVLVAKIDRTERELRDFYRRRIH